MFSTKRLLTVSASLLLATTVAAGSARAGSADVKDSKKQVIEQKPTGPKWYFSLGFGIDADYRTTHLTYNATSNPITILNSPSADGTLASLLGRTGTLRTESRRYDAVYPYGENGFYRFQAELGYVVSPQGEIFGNFRYTRANSDTVRIGTFQFDPINTFDLNLNPVSLPGFKQDALADFGDYKSYSLELGFRYFFLPPSARLRPYATFSAGASYVESIDVNIFLRDGTPLFNGEIYGGGVVASTSLLAGVEYSLTRNFSLGFEGGLRYEFDLSTKDEDVNRVGLGQINRSGDRFYLPVTLYGKFRF